MNPLYQTRRSQHRHFQLSSSASLLMRTTLSVVLLIVVAPSNGFKLYDGYYNSLFRPMAEQSVSFKAKVETLGAVLKRHVQQLRSTPNRMVDLVFLVDSSASVGGLHFLDEIKFVRKLLADFTVDINTTRVAVITFSSRDKVVRQVDHFTYPGLQNHKCSLLVDEIPNIKYVGGGTYTLGAFLEAQSVLESARPNAEKAVILITDGFSNGGDPRPEARKLKQQGVKIFTFGIRNGNVRELWEMASEPRNETCYILDSFEEFEALARRALHSDLQSGTFMPQSDKKCSSLCDAGYCCHENASCTCGTHTGNYECLCKPGYYGNGLGPDGCKPCPSGTYKNFTGAGDVSACTNCPDENQETLPGATLVHECRCKRGFRNFNSSSEECIVFRCPELQEPENGYFVNNQCNNVFNAACGLRCRPGYELRGSGLRICQEDGFWSGQDTHCVLKTCPALPSPKNGHMVCTTDDFRYPTVCRFTCNAGFQLLGSRKRSCLAIAYWTGIAARCREISCPPLVEVRDGIVLPQRCTEKDVPFGTTCQISCLRSYRLHGPAAKQCTPDGTWSADSNEPSQCSDMTPPYIQCPNDIEISANPDNDTTEVTWAVPVAVDNSGFIPVLTSDPAVIPPTQFPIGLTVVTYRAEDLSENVAKCKFYVKVKDDTPPRIDKCFSPAPVVSSGAYGNVTWDRPIFTDNSGVSVEVQASHSPGQFPQGTTTVTYTAFDNSGNNNTCTIDVVVNAHSCQYPDPPVNGDRTCWESEEGVHCTFTCHSGHAFLQEPPPEYFCAYDNIWTPEDRLPFPDCAAQHIANEVLQPASITLTGDLSCAEHKFLNRVEQNIEAKVNDKVRSLCEDNVICELDQVQTTCDEHDDFNRINVVANHRRRRAVKTGGARKSRASITFDFTLEGTVNSSQSYEEASRKHKELSDSMKRLLKGLQSQAKDGQFDMYIGGRWLRFTDMDFDVNRQRNACPQGAVLLNNTCVLCPVGMFYNVVSHNCHSCPKGTYQPIEGQLTCLVCPDMTSTTNDHARSEMECTAQCLPGSVSPTGLERCETCHKGFYQPHYAQTTCLSCPDGSTTLRRGARGAEHCRERCAPGHVSRTGLSPCYPCPYGTYQAQEGQTVCVKCPGEVDTHYRASTSITECIGFSELQSDDAGAYQNQQQVLDASACFNNPCSNGGICVPRESNLFDCICPRGYEGVYCQSVMDQCEAKPCLNGGTCSSVPGSYTCTCPPGFEGKKCERNLDDCVSAPCRNGGTCVDGANSFTCNCPNGFTGTTCDNDIDDCEDDPCHNGGTCHDDVSGFRCSCPDGFSGTTCEIETDECLSASCQNGGVCVDQTNAYRCDCADGYTGLNCEIDTNECESSPCQNGAKCEDLVNGFQCHCDGQFTGVYCETEVSWLYQLDFPSAGTTDYASMTIERPLSALTVAFWMISSDSNSQGTPFSYAVPNMDNALTLSDYNGFVFNVNQEQVVTDVAPNDGFWHHVVITWSSNRGNWKIYVDGLLNDSGFDLSTAKPVPGKGTLVLGQEQDEVGGDFSSSESFIGTITQFNVWDEEFSLKDIERMRVSCEEFHGNVVAWPNIQASLHGSLKPMPSPFCQGCSVPADIKFGKVSYTSLTSGSKVEFSCDRGFNLGGPDSTICLVTGEFEYPSSSISCTPVDCGNPGNIPHGYFQGLKFTFENRVRYTCNRGYKLNGPETLSCNENGDWVGDRPKCVEITCLLPPLSVNTVASPVNAIFRPGDTAAFHCAPGHKLLTSHATVSCQSDGTWDRSVPTCDPQTCSSPPHISFGVPGSTREEYNVGDIVRYTCDFGYTLDRQGSNPTGSISCLPTGDWSKPDPVCVLVDCGEPPLVAYATMDGLEYTFLSRVVYECQPGYAIEGGPAVECLETGNWDPEPPKCEPVDCGAPPDLLNGKVTGQAFSYSSVATYSCLSGYNLVGSMKRRCNETGQWDGPDPVCNPVECGNLTAPTNGIVNVSDPTFKNQAVYDCLQGHYIQGEAIRTCQENGQWSGSEPQCPPVICPPLEDLLHGSYVSPPAFVYGARAVYACNQGYQMIGDAEIVCQNEGPRGYWSTEVPVCEPIECLDPPGVDHATLNVRGLTYTSKAEYECEDGFSLDGESVRTCEADGSWSGEEPVCKSITCNPPPDMTHGSYSYKDLKIGSVVLYQCDVGFRLEGEEIRRCLPNLTLSGSDPSCVSVSCPAPDPPTNGEIALSRDPMVVGSLVTYSCDVGYLISKNNTRLCRADGTLGGSAPVCMPIECDKPAEIISNGRMLGTGFTFSSVIRYACDEGYRMEGSATRVCQANGQWNTTIPICIVVECPRPTVVNGSPSTFRREFGTKVTFTCRPRHRLQGDAERTCLADGSWSGQDPVCIKIICPRPSLLENGLANQVNETHLLYSCYSGYRMDGSNVSVCGEDGRWAPQAPTCTLIICPDILGRLENGLVLFSRNIARVGTKVDYSCNMGYILKGDSERVCMDMGEWTGETPVCQIVQCKPPGDILNGDVHFTNITFGAQVTYTCNKGHVLKGVASRRCEADGLWEGEKPRCEAVTCPGVNTILPNGVAKVQSNTFGGELKYVCFPGYRIDGLSVRTCQASGEWEGEEPRCVALECQAPPKVERGTVVGSDFRVGKNITYVCNEGYELTGNKVLSCLLSQSWDVMPPTCEKITCPSLPPFPLGTTVGDGRRYGDNVIFICNAGYDNQGGAIRRCLANATWDGQQPLCVPKDCGQPPGVDHASVNIANGTLYPINVTFTCDTGYSSQGSGLSRCLANGTWSRMTLSCKIITCPAVIHLPNGQIIGDDFSYGQVIRFTCNLGYQLNGPDALTCVDSGRWDGEMPVCRLVTCPNLPEPVGHGSVEMEEGSDYNSTATYLCDTGYQMQGQPVTRCTETGDWSSESRECVLITCPAPAEVIPNGQLVSSSQRAKYSYQDQVQYSCDLGFELVGSATLTCEAEGAFTPQPPDCAKIQCPAPETPTNGLVQVLNDTLWYSCLPGYELAGFPQRRCLNSGQWEGVSPVCIHILCPPPTPVTDGRIEGIELQFGGTISYVCDTGFNLRGPRNRTCLANRQWSGSEPSCVRVICGKPRQMHFGDVYTDPDTTFSYNDVISYECHQGYKLVGVLERRCLETGFWSDDDPHCQQIECGAPPDVKDANHDADSIAGHFPYGSFVMYTCHTGHVMTGASSTYCQEDGTWSLPLPDCPSVTCTQLPVLDHSQMTGNDFSYGGVITFSCEDGYRLIGSESVTCTETGQWDKPLPSCLRIQCDVPIIQDGVALLKGQADNVPPPTSILPGQDLIFRCLPGYKLGGDSSSTCLEDGTLSGPAPVCLRIICPAPPIVEHSNTRSSGPYFAGDVVRYICDLGFELEGSTSLTCGDDAAWQGDEPGCVDVVCDNPPHIENAVVTGNGLRSWATPVDGWVQYSCQEGFTFDGLHDGRVHCLRGGAWSSELPRCVHIDCGLPPVPLFASVTHAGSTAGSIASVMCNPGYVLTNGGNWTELVCDVSGTWAGADDVSCQPIDCHAPPVVAHAGFVDDVNTTFGSSATYQCLPGYQLTGSEFVVCTKDGVWESGPDGDPECHPVDCGLPPTVPNSQPSPVPATTFGTKATFSCRPGYRLLGDANFTCSENGLWVGERGGRTPQCEAIKCASPPAVANSAPFQRDPSRTFGSRVTYECLPGYRLTGDGNRECSEKGEWVTAAGHSSQVQCLPVDCLTPPVVSHSAPLSVVSTTLSSTVTYVCLPGYRLFGQGTVRCQANGHWLPVSGGPLPSCVPITCPSPPTNAHFPRSEFVFGVTLTLTCLKATRMVGPNEITCMADGRWSPDPGHCEKITCPPLALSEDSVLFNAERSKVSWEVGERAEIICEDGFLLVGAPVIECQSDGTWSAGPPTCKLLRDPSAMCDDTVDFENVIVPDQESYFPGDAVELSCRPGYRPEGDMASSCKTDRTWTKPLGTCQRISCGPPAVEEPQHVKVFGRGYLYGDQVMYICRPGLSPATNPPTLTCTETGLWSGVAGCAAQCKLECQNGGRCVSLNQCKCLPGYTGHQCQTPICILPCLNGGVCQAPYRCQCPVGYFGSRCHQAVCSRPCENGGRCLHPNRCQCFNGFQPPFCEASSKNGLKGR